MKEERRLLEVRFALAIALSVLFTATARAGVGEDLVLRGYAQAILEREFGLPYALSDVHDGVIWLHPNGVEGRSEEVIVALEELPGVVDVRLAQDAGAAVPPVDLNRAERGGPAPSEGLTLLPARPLFEPLTADPRWPRFSAVHQSYRSDPELDNVGAVSFGGIFPIVQGDLFLEGRWDLGLQAGVFSIFDLDASSLDLVNSDFWVGFPIGARWGLFSLTLRPYHQSSHLGDEYLLRDRVERVNVSFEGADALASFDLWSWGRIYGGGGYLVNRNPSALERKHVQAGVELVSPWALFDGHLRPVAAFDAQRREEQDWETDYSARAGFRLENPRLLGNRRLLILAEYYKGRSPNGQFFDRKIEFWGAGLHMQF